MKKLLYMVVAVLALSSCNNWFDVAPKEEYIDEDALFSSESAFRNALNGIYTELRSSELFGSNLGLGGIEFMGQTLVPDSELKPIAEFDYDSQIMKEKIERFNQDEQLRDMAYKRSLNRWANERDKQDMYEKGKEEGIKQGIIEKSKEKTKQLFNKYYPKEDDSILENLNNEQYDQIFEMILDNRCINEIKELLK